MAQQSTTSSKGGYRVPSTGGASHSQAQSSSTVTAAPLPKAPEDDMPAHNAQEVEQREKADPEDALESSANREKALKELGEQHQYDAEGHNDLVTGTAEQQDRKAAVDNNPEDSFEIGRALDRINGHRKESHIEASLAKSAPEAADLDLDTGFSLLKELNNPISILSQQQKEFGGDEDKSKTQPQANPDAEAKQKDATIEKMLEEANMLAAHKYMNDAQQAQNVQEQ